MRMVRERPIQYPSGIMSSCYLEEGEGEGEGQRMENSKKCESVVTTTTTTTTTTKVASTFVQTPFPILPLSLPLPLDNLHKSITSAAHNFIHFLHVSVSQNPLLTNLLSFPSHFHHFSQVQLRSYRSLNSLSSQHKFAAVLPGDSVAGVVVSNGILNFLNLYNTILVVRLVLTWFPNTPPQIVSPLSTLCDPYLNIFRGIIPPLGGTLDLSPILAFLVLNAFTSAATALPAELPPPALSDLTLPQNKWQRRLQGNKSSNKDSPN